MLSQEDPVIGNVERLGQLFCSLLAYRPLARLHFADMTLRHAGHLGKLSLGHSLSAPRASKRQAQRVLRIPRKGFLHGHRFGSLLQSKLSCNLEQLADLLPRSDEMDFNFIST